MRWRIQGSDASDGSSVLLDIEAESAVDAVAHAHDRQIVVGQVAAQSAVSLRRYIPYAVIFAAAALAVTAVMLHRQLTQARRGVSESEQGTQLALSDLQTARSDLAAARARVQLLEGSLTDRERKRDEAEKAAAARLAAAEQTLHAAQSSFAALQQSKTAADDQAAALAAQLTALKREFSVAQAQREGMEKSLEEAARDRAAREKQLAAAAARAADAESRAAELLSRTGELAAQVKVAENSAAAARAQLEQAKTDEDNQRYALAVSYDVALDFVAMQFGKPAVEALRGSPTHVKVAAVQPEHANTFVMHTDKERVFDATLQVCLAADAPKEVLADNRATLGKYLAAFAPQWEKPDAWLAEAFKQIAGKGDGERLVLLTDHYRISVAGNKQGQFSVRIEPAQADEK